MRPDRMTTKSQEALRSAADIASRRGNPEIVPEHLVHAMLEQDGGIARPLFQKAGGDPEALTRRVDAYVQTCDVPGRREPKIAAAGSK